MFVGCCILGILSAILLFLFICQRIEIRNITRQLREINPQDTNRLVHSMGSSRPAEELINTINAKLREVQELRMQFGQKNHALEQMMTNISHDLRTPLTSAMGYIDMVQDAGLPQEVREREIAVVEKRLLRLEELIDSFFEFSKIISSDESPHMAQLNLIAVLEESVANYYDDYCSKNRDILFCCGKKKIDICSNANMLMRIFDNLIGNALKHGTGTLSIAVEVSDKVRIRFENGLMDSDIEVGRIFDEFYTTDISRTKGNTGLGLSIAKQFTQMLGGQIAAEYKDGVFAVTVIL